MRSSELERMKNIIGSKPVTFDQYVSCKWELPWFHCPWCGESVTVTRLDALNFAPVEKEVVTKTIETEWVQGES